MDDGWIKRNEEEDEVSQAKGFTKDYGNGVTAMIEEVLSYWDENILSFDEDNPKPKIFMKVSKDANWYVSKIDTFTMGGITGKEVVNTFKPNENQRKYTITLIWTEEIDNNNEEEDLKKAKEMCDDAASIIENIGE